MANLNLSEIVKCGIQIEKNGRDFYDTASKSVRAEKVKQIFEYISNEEQSHIAVFEGIVNEVDAGSKSAKNCPAEYSQYLLALMEENSFTKIKQGYETARTIRNDKHALELALAVEKDSLLFYHELKRALEHGLHSDIDKLIVSEQDHFNKLSEVYKGFSKFGVNRG